MDDTGILLGGKNVEKRKYIDVVIYIYIYIYNPSKRYTVLASISRNRIFSLSRWKISLQFLDE